MLTPPRLKINDIVVVWEKDNGGEWTQARVVDAQFNRYRKVWEYSAVVEFVDEEDHVQHTGGHHEFGENGHHMIFECPHTYKTQEIAIKQWYCFNDSELKVFTHHQLKEPFYLVDKSVDSVDNLST